MNISLKPDQIDVVILCGGKGKRLQPVLNDRPKPMAKINGRPFLDILIDYIANYGFQRFILCTGYMRNFIKEYYQKKKGEIEILFSEERGALGTAGAIKNAEPIINSSTFMVMNGDSICKIDLSEFIKFHFKKNALISMAVTKKINNTDYGAVTLNYFQQIDKFREKINDGKDDFVNAGVYLFQKEVLKSLPLHKCFSLENDFLPVFDKKRFYGYITSKILIDIGTPKSYKNARRVLKNILYEK